MKKDFLLDRDLINRRDMLLRGGKTIAGAVGLAALAGAGGSRLFTAAGGTLRPGFGATRLLEHEAAEALAFAAPETCELTCALTLGPCYSAAGALVRRDITSGATGLPMRLGFRVVYAEDCRPVVGASVDVWHTNAGGIYSALTNQMCTLGNNVASQNFCRGVQVTDADGRVYFDSVFPGWYSGRTTHIHLTVRLNNTEYVTSQFGFADRVSDFIYRKHAGYNTRGLRNTNNTNDGIINTSNLDRFSFDTRYKAGQLQAFKTVAISASSRCNG